MTKKEEMLEKLLQKPKGMRFDEIKRILENEGFKNVRTRGSHFIFKNNDTGKRIIIPSHNNTVKKYYLEEIIKILNLEDKNEK
jgi:predicted RNA binding protein YcfA (HicA-like mRNA interferase family)